MNGSDMKRPRVAGERARPVSNGSTGGPDAAADPTVLSHLRDDGAEEAVLGAMLHYADGVESIVAAARVLDPEDFASHAHATLFRALVDLRQRGGALDLVSIAAEIRRRGEENIIAAGSGSLELELTRLAERAPSGANVAHHAGIVRDRADRRRAVAACEKAARDFATLQVPIEEIHVPSIGAGGSARPPTPPTIPGYVPFPLDALPPVLAEHARAHSEAIGCDPAMVALPLLAVVASAIGTTRRARVKQGWSEPAVLWSVVVADSGAQKSPPLDAALAPLLHWQAARMGEHAEAMESYRKAKLRFERDLANWKKSKSQGDPPVPPALPVARRVMVQDVTMEALVALLRDCPRGLLHARDELSGWLRSFDAYRGGRGGDVARWLELHRAGPVTVDRRTGEERTLHVPRGAVFIAGTIQPRVLALALNAEHFSDGLAARLLLAMPPRSPRRWRDAVADPAVDDAFAAVVARLLALEFDQCGDPIDLEFDEEATRKWIPWYDAHGRRYDELTGDLAAAWSKLEGAAARIALVHALVVDPTARSISVDSLRAGCTLADWFGREVERVYMVLSESPLAAEHRELIDWIARAGGEVTARELMRSGPRRYRSSSAVAEAALLRLVGVGRADRVERGHGSGPGRPTWGVRLRTDDHDDDPGDGDGIPANVSPTPPEPPGFVAVEGASP